MKTLLFLFLSYGAVAQTQYDYLGGLPLTISNNTTVCSFFDFEGNGENDIKFVFGGGVNCYIEGVSSTALFPTYKSGLWMDCRFSTPQDFNKTKAYLSVNGVTPAIGSHCFPFIFNGQYGYFVINVIDSNTIKIRGYVFGNGSLQCFDINTTTPINNNPTE